MIKTEALQHSLISIPGTLNVKKCVHDKEGEGAEQSRETFKVRSKKSDCLKGGGVA